MRTAGLIILAIWLILHGLNNLVDLNFANKHLILAYLQLVAAALLIIDSLQTRLAEIGLLLLAIWLVITGIETITGYNHHVLTLLRSGLAILAGLLIIFRR